MGGNFLGGNFPRGDFPRTDVNVNEIVVSSKFSLDKKGFKYFIGCKCVFIHIAS